MSNRDNLFYENGKFDWGSRIHTRWNGRAVFIDVTPGLVRVHGLDIPYDFDTVAQAKMYIRNRMKEELRG